MSSVTGEGHRYGTSSKFSRAERSHATTRVGQGQSLNLPRFPSSTAVLSFQDFFKRPSKLKNKPSLCAES